MSYKKYDKYKDSGIEWIGEIPEHWGVKKIKHIGKTIAGGTPSTNKPEYWGGNIPWIPSGKVQNNIIYEADIDKYITQKGLENSSTKYINPNSVLIALTGATCGNIGLLTFKSTANQSVVGIEPYKNTISKYLFYYLISQREQILINQTGGAQSGINEGNVKNIQISFPPLHEQQQIAECLDKKTKEIDDLIKDLKKSIELLKEYKKSLIYEATTGKIKIN